MNIHIRHLVILMATSGWLMLCFGSSVACAQNTTPNQDLTRTFQGKEVPWFPYYINGKPLSPEEEDAWIAEQIKVLARMQRFGAPRPRGEWPWLQVQAGPTGGLYGYTQQPVDAYGPLLWQSISFGQQGATPASVVGYQARVRGYLPTFPYAGVDFNYTSTYYSLALGELLVVDWLQDLSLMGVARYAHAWPSFAVHLGGRVGFESDDFILYRQGVEEDVLGFGYETLNINALQAGGEMGVDLDMGLSLLVTADFGFSGGSTFYRSDYAGRLSYALGQKNWFLFTDANFIQRQAIVLSVFNQPVGTVGDQTISLTLGVGYQRF